QHPREDKNMEKKSDNRKRKENKTEEQTKIGDSAPYKSREYQE
ncbi:36426_t:CDS:1, partial [Racocetra persica]